MRKVQAQHRGVYTCQRIQPEESEDDPPAGSVDQRIVVVREVTEEGEADGAPDQEPPGVQGVRL